MMSMNKLKTSILVCDFDWRTMLSRLILTLLLLAAVVKIGY